MRKDRANAVSGSARELYDALDDFLQGSARIAIRRRLDMTRLDVPVIDDAPPPPDSRVDAFVGQSRAERTWEETLAVDDALDQDDRGNRTELPGDSGVGPLGSLPYQSATTIRTRS